MQMFILVTAAVKRQNSGNGTLSLVQSLHLTFAPLLPFLLSIFLKLESILQFCLPMFVRYYLYLILKTKEEATFT